MLSADITVREYGEDDRVRTIGPFFPVDPDDMYFSITWLEEELARQGYQVERVYETT